MIRFTLALLVGLVINFAAATSATAVTLEELLANPAIQAWLNRQGDMAATVAMCRGRDYRARNAQRCQQAEDAQNLLTMAPELRLLLSRPATASSIRELCLGVQGMPMQNSYLCAELYRADAAFKRQAEQIRVERAKQEDRP